MTTRDELYHTFGPTLVEAICRVLVDQINALRSNAGLPTITTQQAIDAIKTELEGLTKYDWMT